MSSDAVVLVGGLGTRLRPLTNAVPKPLVPVAGVPLMTRILERLRRFGFTTVTLAVQYLADQFRAWYGDGSALGIELRIVEEPEPLGTAGALRYALANAGTLPANSVLVLNGDELTTLDWRALATAHAAAGDAWGTIAVREVADPRAFGVVVSDESGRVRQWQEKPAPGTALANTINSGAYMLGPAAIKAIPAQGYAMLERDLFPRLLEESAPLYSYRHDAYSQDIGTLAGYLAANAAVLLGDIPEYTPLGTQLAPGIWIGDNVVIEADCRLQSPIYLGAGSFVGAETELQTVVAWERVTIGSKSHIREAALAADSHIQSGSTLVEMAYGPAAKK